MFFNLLSTFKNIMESFLFKHKHDHTYLWELRTFYHFIDIIEKEDWIYYHEKKKVPNVIIAKSLILLSHNCVFL